MGETVWPTTTTTTSTLPPLGCCFGDSYKADGKCRAMDDDQARCEKQGCTFLETEDPTDCDITTTSTTSTTSTTEVGCCYGRIQVCADGANGRALLPDCLKITNDKAIRHPTLHTLRYTCIRAPKDECSGLLFFFFFLVLDN